MRLGIQGKMFKAYFCHSYRQITEVSIRVYEFAAEPFYHYVKKPLERRFPGWRLGVVMSIAIALISLLLNITFLIIGRVRHEPRENGLGTFQEGSCNSIGTFNLLYHGVINIMSTVSTVSRVIDRTSV